MHSMTGFGRSEQQIEGSQFSIEVKSVNHRYLDTRFRLPGFLSAFEIRFADVLRNQFSRGAFDISIRHKLLGGTQKQFVATRFALDAEAAKSLSACVEQFRKDHAGDNSVDLGPILAANSRVIVPAEEAHDLEELYPHLESLLKKALAELAKAREAEGGKLKAHLERSLTEIETTTKEIIPLATAQPKAMADKLELRLKEWDLRGKVDNQRLEAEVALMAEKSDITEEIDRLQAHTQSFRQLLSTQGSIGRQLDFLTQELNREFNTLGAKGVQVELTQAALRGKNAVEKLRQQVQNVE